MSIKFFLIVGVLLSFTYQKTVIDVYIESLCPDCVRFLSTSFKQFHNFKTPNLLTLNFIPYGKANQTFNQETKRWEFTCQHEKDECYGNIIETCAINLLGREQSYPFLICMYENILENDKKVDETMDLCLDKTSDIYKEIKECSTSELGNRYEHLMGLKTGKVDHVPYVKVDGEYNAELENQVLSDLIKFACSLPGNDCSHLNIEEFKELEG